MFGCNLQIYGYSTKPESWGSAEEDEKESEKQDGKKNGQKAESDKKSDKAETTAAKSE